MKKLGFIAAVVALAPVLALAQVQPTPVTIGTLTSVSGVFTFINKLVGWFIALFWIAAVVMVLWAAFTYVTAAGDEKKVETAGNMLKYAAIGIAVALLSTTLRPFITSFLSGQ